MNITEEPARVASLVLNSVSGDARVLKEANSLVKNGYKVTVFGLKLSNKDLESETIDNAVKVERANYYLARRKVLIQWAVLFFAITAVLLSCLKYTISRYEFNATTGALVIIQFLFFLCFLSVSLLSFENIRREMLKLFPDISLIKKCICYVDLLRSHLVNASYERALVGKIIQFSPSIVHAHDLSALPIAVRIKRKIGCKVVYDSHEIFEEMSDKTPVTRQRLIKLQRKLSSYVDLFITINDSIGLFLSKRYPHLPEPVVIKNASCFDNSKSHEEKDWRLYEKGNIGKDKKIILYQGGFSKDRGLVEIVRNAKFFPSDWVLVLMGDGVLKDELIVEMNQSNLIERKVVIVPKVPQSELAYWTSGATVGVIPYINSCLNHWYCTPNKLWEYPRSGVPIIASSFPEIKKTVEQHQIGWLVEDFVRETELVNILTNLSDEGIEKAKNNSIQFIQMENWSHQEKKLVKAYNTLSS